MSETVQTPDKNYKRSSYFVALTYIVLGCAMVFFPKATLNTICYILAAVMAVAGIACLIMYFTKDLHKIVYRHDFVIGVMLLLVSVIILLKTDIIVNVIPIIMGVIIFASGIIKLQHAINLARFKYSGWIFVMVISIICIALGIFTLVNPSIIASVFIVFVGISLIISGVTDGIILWMIGRGLKKLDKENGIVADVEAEIVEADNTEQ